MTSEVLTEARSRRAILAALGGGVAALVAQALGRPLPARAANNDPVTVGNPFTGTTETSITVTGNATGFRGRSASGLGLKGVSDAGAGGGPTNTGVYGQSGPSTNAATDTTSTGVYGYGEGSDLFGNGVWGDSENTGVFATGGDFGVVAEGFWGVAATGGSADFGVGVVANGNTGVWASTGGSNQGPAPNSAISAEAEWPNSAASFRGRTVFSRAGKAVIPAGNSFVYKAMPLRGNSLIFAVVLSNRGGLWVQRAVLYPNSTAPTGFRVYLNANVPAGTPGVYVSYFIVN
jgi:hypothetical protein